MKTFFSAATVFLGLLALACIGWMPPVTADAIVAAVGMEEAADSVVEAGDEATRVRRGRINARMLQYSNGYYSGGHYSSSGSNGSKKGKKSKKSKKGKGSKGSKSSYYYH